MFCAKQKKKNKKDNPPLCHRRLGIFKKKLYKNNHQLIYISLSGHVYTSPNYREVSEFDNDILTKLNISKTGEYSSINNDKFVYETVNDLNKIENFIHDEKNFEYYYIPPSIIRKYNEIGIYELHDEQVEFLRNAFENEYIENGLNNKKDDIIYDATHVQDINEILNSEFFSPFENFGERGEMIKCLHSNVITEHIQEKNMNETPIKNIQNDKEFYKNFLFSMPTGMGKTLIYDIIIIRFILYKGYRVILTLPTVSLINEKYDYYEMLLGNDTVSLNIKKFNSFNFTGYSYSLSTDIALCTYEQANIIINIIIKNNLKSNFIFIIDEIHYINDLQRGFFIESLLTKIKYAQKNYNHIFNLRAYGFSATLSNIDHIGRWLEAKIRVSSKKTQKIKYLYKIKNVMYKDIEQKYIERTLDIPYVLDPDHLGYILSEELILKRNVLIFCSTKKQSEKVASFISNVISYYLKNIDFNISIELLEKRKNLINQLNEIKDINTKIVEIEKLIINGIFYHHAELGKYEKDIIENALRNNILFCLCCTTTLSVGVNFNVHTIIIRNIQVGISFLTKDQIIQISGRCGRLKKKVDGNSNLDIKPLHYNNNKGNNNLHNETEKYELTKVMNTNNSNCYVKDYDTNCDGKVIIFLNCKDDIEYLKMLFRDNVDKKTVESAMEKFNLCKFIIELIELNIIKTKKDILYFFFSYALKFCKYDMETSQIKDNGWLEKYKEKIILEIKQIFQYLFDNKLIVIPYEKEQNYYYYIFEKIYNINLYEMENIFNFNFLNQHINTDMLIKSNLQQKIHLFKNLCKHYKSSNILDTENEKSTIPFITIFSIFKDTHINKNIFPNLFVQFIKNLFLININNKQNNFYVYDILEEDDELMCSEISSYAHSASTSLDFIFNYSIIHTTYVKGFSPDTLLMIFVFCLGSEINLKINFEVYETALLQNDDRMNTLKIFKYLDLNLDILRKYKMRKNDNFKEVSERFLKGEINIEEISQTFEWVKIKRFYFSLIIYELFNTDLYTVSRKYKLKTKELKNLYIRSCYNLSFNCKAIRNFKNSLSIFCIILENLLLKMKSKIVPHNF
ncbi:DEAD box helicase, putative [Plasmodium chabaudi chabaudi]|uniref:DEAD box helicase, putative n=1 Tax=Plasmodium chabaudi chabaudi TaxID=31271 RepID=A0A1C6XMM6_PLACU|nr:DEAD box helicase, putative [Plasmodium chabaudi chabaudi]